MDAKEAVKLAKGYVFDLLQEEGVSELGLEEIEFDENEDVWNITVGFSRQIAMRNNSPFRASLIDPNRNYRVVKVNNQDGALLSVKLREFQH